MTDEQQPRRDLPVAGRAPDPQPAGEETTRLRLPADAGAPVTATAGDEETTRVRLPADAAAPVAATAAGEVAVDDEPTVERPAGPEGDAETQPLRRSAAGPGETRAAPQGREAAAAAGGQEPESRAERDPAAAKERRSSATAEGQAGEIPDAQAGGSAEGRAGASVVGQARGSAEGQAGANPEGQTGASAAGQAGGSPDEQAGRDAGSSPDRVMSGSGAAPVTGGESPSVPPIDTARTADGPAVDHPASPPRRRLSSAGTLIWVLLALFGFTLVVQLRSNDAEDGLATARQEDLVRILSDLEARDTRLQGEIAALETSQRQLTSGVAGREAARIEADKRAAELGLLAGTLPGRGPGLRIEINGVKASAILNAVQELRGAGGEVMQLNGSAGGEVRIVASTYFVDAEGGGIVADGARLSGPYTLWVIGPPQTMQTALQIPGGVVASVHSDGGSVTMEQRPAVEVSAVREPGSLQYARPVS